MLVATADQIRNIDLRTIKSFGISGLELMERAGQGLLEASLRLLDGKIESARVAIFCGKGNNGGDGYVLARLLAQSGAKPECFLLAPENKIKGDAAANLAWLRSVDVPFRVVEIPEQVPNARDYALVVDAIFGVGFGGEVHGIAEAMIRAINAFPGPVLAVDTPSGFDVNTGQASNVCVRATETVTFGLVKAGQFFHPCRQYAGNLVLHDLGLPSAAVDREAITTELVDAEWATNQVPVRKPDGSKMDFGRVLVIAGSRGMTGAALLAARAVLRSGAGMVSIAAPASTLPILCANFMESLVIPLPETKDGSLAEDAFEQLMAKAEAWADALVVGPGMSRNRETAALIRNVVTRVPKPAVVDADGLNAFSGDAASLCRIAWPRVLTPHTGELTRLWPIPEAALGAKRIEWLTDKSKTEVRNTILLKGAPTIIAGDSGKAMISAAGNSGMATAGTGDVLSGIIAGLMAQGMESFEAAALGAYLHGRSGELATKELGEHSLLAGDLLSYLPRAFMECIPQDDSRPQ